MLKQSEIRVGSDSNYEMITKEIRGDFLPEEPRTDVTVRSFTFTDDDNTIRSAAVINNQNRLNLNVFRQIYQMPAQGTNENSGGADRPVDEAEERIKRSFKKKFRDLCNMQAGNKIQALPQLGSVEVLEKELEKVFKK